MREMLELHIRGNTIEELLTQARAFIASVNLAPEITAQPVTEIRPVLTQAQMEENLKNAPKHEMPPQPTIEEVRAALKGLRDRKDSKAVKALLQTFGAESLQELKPEDYLAAMDRAKTEV